MKKNVAGQAIGAQMVSASDGSAFTGAVTVYVTGDAGTQAVGSVGAGACTHEGNGYHTYAPAQAETNYNLVAFTFTGTGAVPATVQVYTSFPQTADVGTGTGLTAIPWNAAWDAEVQSEAQDAITASGLLDAAGVRTAVGLASANLDTQIGTLATAAALTTVDDFLDTEIAAIKAKTDSLTFTVAGQVDANIEYVNGTQVTGTGALGDEWGPA